MAMNVHNKGSPFSVVTKISRNEIWRHFYFVILRNLKKKLLEISRNFVKQSLQNFAKFCFEKLKIR